MAFLRKFVSIDNVGRLANCRQKGPEFKKYNLLFAENGRGKTTLCGVLRSLETGKHEHISERKTIAPTASDPAVVVRMDSGDVRYRNQAWSATVPEIAIFDATFISKNVHAGEFVGRDHRTNLLEVIVGQDGVALSQQVNDLDSVIREKNSEIGKSKKTIEALLPRGMDLDAFLALEEDAGIDVRIEAKKTALRTAKKAQAIAARDPLLPISIPQVPLDFLTVLAKTLDDVSADAQRQLKKQLDKHKMHEHGQIWLSEGLGYLAEDACPFCGEELKGNDLIDAYKQFFSETYADLISDIERLEDELTEALGDAALATLGRLIAANDAGLEFWKQYIETDFNAPNHDTAIAAPLAALRAAAERLIAEKKTDPLRAVIPGAEYKAAQDGAVAASEKIQDYNTAIAKLTEAINEKKEEAAGADSEAIEREIAGLTLMQLRHSDKMKPLCDAHTALTTEKALLDAAKGSAKDALDSHADKMIGQYENTINKLLMGFGAGFTLTNSKKTYVGGKPASVYQILINNHAVDLGDATTPVGQPSFRTTLSTGDKSTLALAFFLAKLDHDPNKAERIIVFDDPFNSQDRSRRERTAELLKKYGSECKQLLLLSHDPYFLNLVYSKLPRADRHCIQLSRVPDNYSTIEEWDVEKETQDGYFKDHAALNSYLMSGARDLIDVARKIRPVLEGYMRYRFPNEFQPGIWLGEMIGHVRSAGVTHPMHDALEELAAINDYSKKYHHDTNPGKADSEPLDDGELSTFVSRTLSIVGGY